MKKNISKNTLLLLSLVFFSYCNNEKTEYVNTQNDIEFYNYHISNKKITEIANKYGFSKENLTNSDKKEFIILSFLDSSYIKCCSEASLEQEFSNLRNFIDRNRSYDRQDSIFNARKRFVRSYKEYYDLIETLPYKRDAMIELNGGEVNYRRFVDSISKVPVHVYLDEKGILTFVPIHLDKNYDTKDGTYPGIRLDNAKN